MSPIANMVISSVSNRSFNGHMPARITGDAGKPIYQAGVPKIPANTRQAIFIVWVMTYSCLGSFHLKTYIP